MRSSLSSKVQVSQKRQKISHERGSRTRSFHVLDMVYTYNFAQGPRWLLGTIVKHRGLLSYVIKLEGGREVWKHVDHIRQRTVSAHTPNVPEDDWLRPVQLPIHLLVLPQSQIRLLLQLFAFLQESSDHPIIICRDTFKP